MAIDVMKTCSKSDDSNVAKVPPNLLEVKINMRSKSLTHCPTIFDTPSRDFPNRRSI